MTLSGGEPDDQRTAGFALFAVLSFSLLAAAIAAPFLTGSKTRALVARNVAQEMRGNMSARGLMNIAAARLAEKRKAPDFVMPRAVDCRIGNGFVSFAFQGHGGLIDLNRAPRDLLVLGFRAFGYDMFDAGRLAETVIQFRAADGAQQFGDLDIVRGGFKHAEFETISELADFNGTFPSSLPDRQLPFTVHNGTGTIYYDQVPEELQLALKAVPETQAYFVVQGSSAPSAVSIRVILSIAGRPGFQAAAIARSADSEVGQVFLSPISVTPAFREARNVSYGGDCSSFFGDALYRAINILVTDQ